MKAHGSRRWRKKPQVALPVAVYLATCLVAHVAVLLWHSNHAEAIVCDCSGPPEPEEAFLLAGSVFQGRVAQVEELPDEDLFILDVAAVWKGDAAVSLEVFSHSTCSCCAACLQPGQDFIVYAVVVGGSLHANHASFFQPFGGRVAAFTRQEVDLLGPPMWTPDGQPAFRRGDANADGSVDLSDAVSILEHLFATGKEMECLRGGDIDDDGNVEINDAIYLLSYLYLGGRQPGAPFLDCLPDPTPDSLSCEHPPDCA